jgi:hypothetical protein
MMPVKFYISFTWAIYRGQKTWMILAGKQCIQVSLHMAGTTGLISLFCLYTYDDTL